MDSSSVFNSQDTSVSIDHLPDPYFAHTKKTLDPIHNFIVFDSDVWQFIDTPEFQRLRDIKQLGGVSYVFPGANHTRFEHCLGTGHLAQKLVKTIYKHQTNILTDFDSVEYSQRIKKNVTLAGVLHDLGHGPFSHLFDHNVIGKLYPGAKWSHEKGSAMLLEKLVDDNHIDVDREDVRMIADLILGDRGKSAYADKTWIFDIVANSKNSIDVDKYDYMTRDSFHLGLKDTYFDYRALIKESRVIGEEICFPAKLSHKVYELFQVRYKLFKEIYHNRAAKAVELMLTEILLNSNSYYNFGEIIQSPAEYAKLTDYIIKEIELSKAPELEKSRQIIERLRRRDIYKFASETIVDVHHKISDDERMKVDILSCAKQDGLDNLTMEDFYVVKGTNTFGFKDKNPVDYVKFYNKNNINKSFLIDKDQVSLLLPAKFGETFIRVYASESSKVEAVRNAFNVYCNKILHAKMGPIESKSLMSEGNLKPRKHNSLGMLSNEPEVMKKLLLGDSKFVIQNANAAWKSANATPAKMDKFVMELKNQLNDN